jgi:O-methyltransferase
MRLSAMSVSIDLYDRAVRAVQSAAASAGIGIASYRMPARTLLLNKVRRLRASRTMLLTPVEAFQIGVLVSESAKLGGNMAEVGVFKGASARLIRECDPSNRTLHLFDTFEGLPETAEGDVAYQQGRFKRGEFACSLESVRGI